MTAFLANPWWTGLASLGIPLGLLAAVGLLARDEKETDR